jgi:hypothetical protein
VYCRKSLFLIVIRQLADFILKRSGVDVITQLNSLRDLLNFCSVHQSSKDTNGFVDVDATRRQHDDENLNKFDIDEDDAIEHSPIWSDVSDRLTMVIGLFPKVLSDSASSDSDNDDADTVNSGNENIRPLAVDAFMSIAAKHSSARFAISHNQALADHFDISVSE